MYTHTKHYLATVCAKCEDVYICMHFNSLSCLTVYAMTLTSAKNTFKERERSLVTKGEKPGICLSMKSGLSVVKRAPCITRYHDLTFRPSLNLVTVYSFLCACLHKCCMKYKVQRQTQPHCLF